jgi:hypothetical protein
VPEGGVSRDKVAVAPGPLSFPLALDREQCHPNVSSSKICVLREPFEPPVRACLDLGAMDEAFRADDGFGNRAGPFCHGYAVDGRVRAGVSAALRRDGSRLLLLAASAELLGAAGVERHGEGMCDATQQSHASRQEQRRQLRAAKEVQRRAEQVHVIDVGHRACRCGALARGEFGSCMRWRAANGGVRSTVHGVVSEKPGHVRPPGRSKAA